MRVGLFVPCHVDQFQPQVGLAVLDLLERRGIRPRFESAAVCCGQPMANTGFPELARPLARTFLDAYHDCDHVICPSGSCTAMIRRHWDAFHADIPGLAELCARTRELGEFLTDVLGETSIRGRFPHRVGLHQSCHGLRELRLARSSETVGEPFGRLRPLLASIEGLVLAELSRPDECCGFGGTFAVAEEAVSCMMGLDRVHDHEQAGSEIVVSVDTSCLMHLGGLIRRQDKPIRTMHVAELIDAAERAVLDDPDADAARSGPRALTA